MTDQERDPSRRSILAGAGVAVAAGVTAAVAAPAADATTPPAVAAGPPGGTVVEFRGRIAQTGDSGQDFAATGFLTRLHGARQSDLFAGAPAVGTALFTVYATGTLRNRVLDKSVHALDIAGELKVYQRAAPGASFGDPSSFRSGREVASFGLLLQDVLTVFAPATGIPTLTGDMVQDSVGALRGGLAGQQFGARHQRLRLFATGLGMLTDPVTLNADLEIAGNWTAT